MPISKNFKDPSIVSKRNNVLNEYRKTAKFTDLCLKSTDNETLAVHKHILSASCPYFQSKLDPDYIEEPPNPMKLDVTMDVLEIFVNYFYIGEIRVTWQNALNLYKASKYFELVELVNFCTEFLIENLKLENCLDYYREAVSSSNDKLNIACKNFIKLNCKSFLDNYYIDLKIQEFKVIIAIENLTIDQEELCKFMIKWIKKNPKNDFMDLFKLLDHTKLSYVFLRNKSIFDDHLIKQYPELSIKIWTIISEEPIQNIQNRRPMITSERLLNFQNNTSKSIYLFTNCGIYKLNLSSCKWIKELSFEKKQIECFATASLKEDIFLSGGWVVKDNVPLSDFESWNVKSGKINYLPQMKESRFSHSLINFNGKIYSCGGDYNNASVETFDCENVEWSNGPKMNDKKSKFGLVSTADSIYAFGGYNNLSPGGSKIVEQCDPRTGKWTIISKDGLECSKAAAILSNNSVYCFNNIFGGQKFDLRKNTWSDRLPSVCEHKDCIQYCYKCWTVVECNNEIFGVFQTDNINTWGTFIFNHDVNKWSNLNIPLHLDEYADIQLCVISE